MNAVMLTRDQFDALRPWGPPDAERCRCSTWSAPAPDKHPQQRRYCDNPYHGSDNLTDAEADLYCYSYHRVRLPVKAPVAAASDLD